MTPKYFIGPMSKNVVDTIIEFCNKTNNTIGLIPSRRQVEWDGGYVNNWTTQEFTEYVKSKTDKILLVRDHSGPGQGQSDDDGYQSLSEDCKYLDLVHIDPWKKYPTFDLGLKETIKMIEYCYDLNPNIQYEVGTEEAIRQFKSYELEDLVHELKSKLNPEIYNQIKYLVIQSGTSLKGTNQTGNYDSDRLFGLIETLTYLDEIKDNNLFEKYFQICYDSKKWVKWVNENFDPHLNKEELIKICGHYVLSNSEFLSNIKSCFPNIDDKIKSNISNKLKELYGY